MTRYRCSSCLGEYDDAQPGGYYHACPPVRNPAFKRPNIAVAGIETLNPAFDPAIPEYVERADKRDENPDPADPAPHKRIKSAGKGRVEAP